MVDKTAISLDSPDFYFFSYQLLRIVRFYSSRAVFRLTSLNFRMGEGGQVRIFYQGLSSTLVMKKTNRFH